MTDDYSSAIAKVFDQSSEALRQLDENVNRLLGTTAFLALAGFTLFFPSARFGELSFDGHGVAASDVFFFLFDVGIFFSIAFALWTLEVGRGDGLLVNDPALAREWDARALEAAMRTEAVRHGERAAMKAERLRRCRAAIEFSMISLALLGTARLPHVSADTKGLLIVVALALYGYGATWRVSEKERHWTKGFFFAVSTISAALLLFANRLDSHWWQSATRLSGSPRHGLRAMKGNHHVPGKPRWPRFFGSWPVSACSRISSSNEM